MTRYASHQFYNQQMAKALAAPEIKRRRYATVAPTSIGSNIEALSEVGKQLLDAYQTKRAQVRDEQDIANAFRMLKDRNAPQKEWDVEEYGSTPETLRAATMPGALTGGAPPTSAAAPILRARSGGARALIPVDVQKALYPDEKYLQDVIGDEPNEAGFRFILPAPPPRGPVGTPIDPNQPFALGTDEEGDDANWMSPEEHKAFYEDQALKAQATFDQDNPYGMAAVNQGDYNLPGTTSLFGETTPGTEGPRTMAMKLALMGQQSVLDREEADRVRAAEMAKLTRSQNLSDIAADRKFRAGESVKSQAAADARYKAATRQRLEYFGATQKAAEKRILDERKYKEAAKRAEDAIVKAEAKKKEQQQLEGTAVTQDIMVKALDGAFAALDAAKEDSLSLGAAGTLSQIPAILSTSHAGKLRSHVKTLKSPIVMGGIENLRKSSAAGATGFGAMNKEELGILINRLGALDPDTTDPGILRDTLKGIQTQVEVVKKDVLAKVPHSKLRIIGLGHWLPKTLMPPSAVKAGVTQDIWNNMTLTEKKVFE